MHQTCNGLGAVVLCYGPDAQEHVRPLVMGLLNQGLSPAEVTIVHNPTESSASFDPPVGGLSVIIPDRNLGYAGGMNLGIRDQTRKGRKLVLLLTMDVRFDPGAVARMCEAAQRSTYGILGPELRWAGSDHTTWGMRWDSAGRVEHVASRPLDDDNDGVVESDAVDGAVVLIKAEVLQTIGPLKDYLFMYFEETEFCLRATRAGWRVGVVYGAVAEQTSGATRRPGAFNYLMARNGLEFARLFAGRLGVAAALWRAVRQTAFLLKVRFNPHSDNYHRRFATTSVLALWLGVAAFFGKRWGPPPADLPGIGDVTFTR